LVDISGLAGYGISKSMVEDALRWMHDQPRIILPGPPCRVTVSLLEQLSKCLHHTKHGQLREETWSPRATDDLPTVVVMDAHSIEAQAAALVLQERLASELITAPKLIPWVLQEGEAIPGTARNVILVCTDGILDRAGVIEALLDACTYEASVLPVICGSGFRVPSAVDLVAQRASLEARGLEVDVVQELMQGVFREIAPTFQPQQDPDIVLDVKAKTIATRLLGMDVHVPTISATLSQSRPSRILSAAV